MPITREKIKGLLDEAEAQVSKSPWEAKDKVREAYDILCSTSGFGKISPGYREGVAEFFERFPNLDGMFLDNGINLDNFGIAIRRLV